MTEETQMACQTGKMKIAACAVDANILPTTLDLILILSRIILSHLTCSEVLPWQPSFAPGCPTTDCKIHCCETWIGLGPQSQEKGENKTCFNPETFWVLSDRKSYDSTIYYNITCYWFIQLKKNVSLWIGNSQGSWSGTLLKGCRHYQDNDSPAELHQKQTDFCLLNAIFEQLLCFLSNTFLAWQHDTQKWTKSWFTLTRRGVCWGKKRLEIPELLMLMAVWKLMCPFLRSDLKMFCYRGLHFSFYL